MEYTPSTRGQRRRTARKRARAMAPAKYHKGTLLVKQLVWRKEVESKAGVKYTKHKTYLQTHKIME